MTFMNRDDQFDTLWINASLLNVEDGRIKKEAWLGVKAGLIKAIGSMHSLSLDNPYLSKEIINIKHKLMTPGLIDPHSHRIYAGNRQDEIDALQNGASYAQIKTSGGGIHRTMTDTKHASADTLYQQTVPRIIEAINSGLTTIELKSGYGPDWETELKILEVGKRIQDNFPLTVVMTFLGAHTLPSGFKSADQYIDLICREMIPKVAALGFVSAVDVFCEGNDIGFNLTQTRRVFEAAQQHHLQIKCHAEQLSNYGGAMLAMQYGACSVDHLEHLPETGPWVDLMKKTGTVAVLLPVSYDNLQHHDPTLPPVQTLKKHHIPIAIGTNCNPGNAPNSSIRVAMNLAKKYYHLSAFEVMQGVTLHAAKALGLEKTHGRLAVGCVADLAIWDSEDDLEKIVEDPKDNRLYQLVKSGIKATS
jgi:imidazolonepropionase